MEYQFQLDDIATSSAQHSDAKDDASVRALLAVAERLEETNRQLQSIAGFIETLPVGK